ncbi:MAG TPA: serine/threonine-protein kinase [Lacipirellulaceae bacterium]|jgi:serine/threonine protein kinase|nr:serine/threonine-protein kinase [Lacipirellulaceae bacterium]
MSETAHEPSAQPDVDSHATATADDDLLAALADDFAARLRHGEHPTVDEYAERHPALAGRIRKVLSSVLVIEHSRSFDMSPVGEGPGSMIGRYKLLERIGEGGFGVVYMAEQQHPVRRKVALKVIKPGVDTRQVIVRFEAERQALALMEHENIAKVLDAGATDSGRPYFVMELVHGVPITEFCDRNQLPPRKRLELFIEVCRAIQHAHTKGIIHRDIKPTNVLVTLHEGIPVPKVIDFGVAKATGQQLTEKTLFTNFAQMVGTPLYMSPEQAEMTGIDVDTRSDVYSLGVLLYELLTGTTPLDKERIKQSAYDEIRRIIREQEPPRPSTRLSTLGQQARSIAAARGGSDSTQLGRLIRGELDWIVMKALAKERARRYETADALARDVERYLLNESVEACPPSALYRLSKFTRRYKGPVLAAAVVLLTLIGGIIGTTYGLVRAEQARRTAAERAEGERRAKEKAQARLAQIENATDILASVFENLDPIAAEKSGVSSRELLSRRLSDTAQQLEGEAVGDPLIVARLQHLLGIVLRELGHLEQAERVLVEACGTRDRLLGAAHLDAVASKHELARLYSKQAKHALAETLHKEVLAIRTVKLGADNLDTLATKHHLAWLYNSQEKYALAETLCKEVLAIRTVKLGADNLDTLATKHLLALVYRHQGKTEAAEPLLREVVAGRSARLGPDYRDTLSSKHYLALVYRFQGKVEPAEAMLTEMVASHTAKFGSDHRETLDSKRDLADVYCEQGKYALAEPLYKEILVVCTSKKGADDFETLYRQYDLATVYRYMRKLDQAIPLLEETFKRTKATQHPATLEVQADLGACYRDVGRFADAIPLLEEVHRQDRADLAWVGNALLTCYVGAGKTTEVVALATEQVRAAREQFPADSPELAAELAPPGQALMEVQKYADAEPLLLIGYTGLKQAEARIPPQVDPRLWSAVDRLVRLYDAWGKPDEAAKWRKELPPVRHPDTPK